jgi:hypothetical protein
MAPPQFTYPTKEAFFVDGWEDPYVPAEETICYVCKELVITAVTPLKTEIAPVSNTFEQSTESQATLSDSPPITIASTDNDSPLPPEPAIRIACCGNVFGKLCLEFWLEENDTCPLCRTVLFSPAAPTGPTGAGQKA